VYRKKNIHELKATLLHFLRLRCSCRLSKAAPRKCYVLRQRQWQ